MITVRIVIKLICAFTCIVFPHKVTFLGKKYQPYCTSRKIYKGRELSRAKPLISKISDLYFDVPTLNTRNLRVKRKCFKNCIVIRNQNKTANAENVCRIFGELRNFIRLLYFKTRISWPLLKWIKTGLVH